MSAIRVRAAKGWPVKSNPPRVVKSHGGPTAAASRVLNLGSSTGRAVASPCLPSIMEVVRATGWAYRDRLHLQWGIVDVEDCLNGAKDLVAEHQVNGARCGITGGSAGDYTTLAALTFRAFFQAGGSH